MVIIFPEPQWLSTQKNSIVTTKAGVLERGHVCFGSKADMTVQHQNSVLSAMVQ